MLGALNQTQIDYLLTSQVIGRIGCCFDNEVYVVPITYAYKGGYIYGHTTEGTKIEIMRSNPNVCFQVDAIQNLANWQSAIVWGNYEELEGELREDSLQIFVNRVQPLMSSETNRPKYGLDRKGAGTNRKTVVFRIKITKAKGRYEKR